MVANGKLTVNGVSVVKPMALDVETDLVSSAKAGGRRKQADPDVNLFTIENTSGN